MEAHQQPLDDWVEPIHQFQTPKVLPVLRLLEGCGDDFNNVVDLFPPEPPRLAA